MRCSGRSPTRPGAPCYRSSARALSPSPALTGRFEISQPAVSQHLKVLREAGLVSERKAGRRRIYALEAGPLALAAEWLERHMDFWASRFDNLGRHLREKHGKDA